MFQKGRKEGNAHDWLFDSWEINNNPVRDDLLVVPRPVSSPPAPRAYTAATVMEYSVLGVSLGSRTVVFFPPT